MSTKVEQLLVIQDRDRKIKRLGRELDDLPARQKMIEAQLSAHQQAYDNAEDNIRKKNLELKELEGEIESRKERIQKFRQQQFEVKNNDDYKAFEKQIAGLNKEIGEIEERELTLMEAVEQLEAVRDERSAALKEEQKDVEADLERFRERNANTEKELQELEAKRKTLAQDMDPEWLSRYERIFENKGDFALVPVENNACGGCHMKLPPQIPHDARKLDRMTACMYCGRLLYYIP